MKIFHANYFVQCKACKNELLAASEQNKENLTDADNNEENDSSMEEDGDNRFNFVRSIFDDASATNSRMSEVKKKEV